MQQRNAAVVPPPGVLHGQSQRQRRAIECSRVKRNSLRLQPHALDRPVHHANDDRHEVKSISNLTPLTCIR